MPRPRFFLLSSIINHDNVFRFGICFSWPCPDLTFTENLMKSHLKREVSDSPTSSTAYMGIDKSSPEECVSWFRFDFTCGVLVGAIFGVIFWGFVTASHRMKDTQRGSLFSRWRKCNSARIAQEVMKQVFHMSDWSRFVTRRLRENACQAACETASASTLLFGKN